MTKQEQTYKVKKPRKKKCKTCKEWFEPEREMQSTCGSIECAIGFAKVGIKKKNNKDKKEAQQNNKSFLMKKAQEIVNKYVRLRDKKLSCVSCNTTQAKWDAGHFKSAGGHQQLRFNTLNIHKQCMRCNQYLSGNLIPYEEELIKRIGKERVQAFKSNHRIAKYSVPYLQKLIKVFRKKVKLYETKES